MIAQDQEEFEKAHKIVQVTNYLNVSGIVLYLQVTTSEISLSAGGKSRHSKCIWIRRYLMEIFQ